MDPLKKEVGSKIADFRKKKGMTQAELAEAADLSLNTIQRYEQGSAYPRVKNAIKIAEALRVGVNDIYSPIPYGEPTHASDFTSVRSGTIGEMTPEELVKRIVSASKQDDLQMTHLKNENERLKNQLKKIKNLPDMKELISAWNNAEPELRTIGLLVLTLEDKYLSRLSPDNRKLFEAYLRAAGGSRGRSK